jgi:hypothetical protein
MRAVRYCEAVALASSFGCYSFPQTEVSLMWDGVTVADMGGDEWPDWTQTVTEPFGDPNRGFGSSAVRAAKPFNGEAPSRDGKVVQ